MKDYKKNYEIIESVSLNLINRMKLNKVKKLKEEINKENYFLKYLFMKSLDVNYNIYFNKLIPKIEKYFHIQTNEKIKLDNDYLINNFDSKTIVIQIQKSNEFFSIPYQIDRNIRNKFMFLDKITEFLWDYDTYNYQTLYKKVLFNLFSKIYSNSQKQKIYLKYIEKLNEHINIRLGNLKDFSEHI